MSLISCVLNAYSGRWADTLVSYIHPANGACCTMPALLCSTYEGVLVWWWLAGCGTTVVKHRGPTQRCHQPQATWSRSDGQAQLRHSWHHPRHARPHPRWTIVASSNSSLADFNRILLGLLIRPTHAADMSVKRISVIDLIWLCCFSLSTSRSARVRRS